METGMETGEWKRVETAGGNGGNGGGKRGGNGEWKRGHSTFLGFQQGLAPWSDFEGVGSDRRLLRGVGESVRFRPVVRRPRDTADKPETGD